MTDLTAQHVVEVARQSGDLETVAGFNEIYHDKVDEALGVPESPQTRDELWDAVHTLTGYAIPRVSVCEGHTAPFTTFADLYFGQTEDGEPVTDVLWIGNRGGGKTTSSGFLHAAKGRWNPAYTTCIVGATEKQSERGYAEFQRFCRHVEDEIISMLKKQTLWNWGSFTEIITGTMKGVNGPHPYLAQFDEVELTQEEIYEEWLNMSQGDQDFPGQNLLTSTRKFSYGIVQRIVKECEQAEIDGEEPPYRVDIFCVWETVENTPGCGTTCGCDKVVKGKNVDPQTGATSPRTLMQVCDGRARRANGFVPLKDVKRRFRQLSRRTWHAQQECREPGQEGVVHGWLDVHHKLPFWYPKPEFGPVYRSWDWGGTNPHSVHWHQLVKVPILLKGNYGGQMYERQINPGQLVTFDEVYHSGGGFGELGIEVFERTLKWQNAGYEFEVAQDVCDPAGATAKVDVTNAAKNNGYEEPQWKTYPCPKDDSLDKHIEWGEDDNLLIVPRYTPMLVYEYERYHWPERKPDKPPPKFPVEVDDHAMDENRYMIWYLYKIGVRTQSDEVPQSEFQKRGHPMQDENQRVKQGRKSGVTQPGGSALAPGYTSDSPFQDESTVRTNNVPSVRRG